jgi:hypothetical protein
MTSPFIDLGTISRRMVGFMSRPLYPLWEKPRVPIGQEAGLDPAPVWTLWSRKIVYPLPGIEP